MVAMIIISVECSKIYEVIIQNSIKIELVYFNLHILGLDVSDNHFVPYK